MERGIYFILIIVSLLSCSTTEEIPKEVLEVEVMVDIVVDIELSQAVYKLKFANKDSLDYQQLVENTFGQFNTTQEIFNNSLAYYSKHPKKMEDIYNQAIIRLTERQVKNQKGKAN